MARKILVVDDEPAVLTSLCDRLKHEGYDVFADADGRSGDEYVEREKPGIILVDVALPDMDGNEFCRAVKDKEKEGVSIIVMTSKLEAIDAVKAREAGADDFAVKTTDFGEVIAAIKRLEES